MKELDIEKRRTDSLLYQMIPRTVADRLRQGEPALNTCEVCKFTTPCHLLVLIGHCNLLSQVRFYWAKLCALCVYPFPVAITHLLFFKKPSVNINMYLHMCSTWALSNDYAINPLNPECVSVFFFSRCSMMCLCCSVMWLDLHTFVHLLAPWKW